MDCVFVARITAGSHCFLLDLLLAPRSTDVDGKMPLDTAHTKGKQPLPWLPRRYHDKPMVYVQV